MSHRFRFGVVAEQFVSAHAWIEKAQRAEGTGYASFLVPHHISLSPFGLLMAAANATSTIKIGSFVFNIDFVQNPLFWATEAATLDQISHGRLELGLGPGYMEDEYVQAGVPFDDARVRISRFEEALSIIKSLLATEERVTYTGTYYTLDHKSARLTANQKPHPPIYIGGGGQRMLTIAAQQAQIVGIVPRSTAHGLESSAITALATAQKIAWVRQAAGEHFSQLELSTMVFHVQITDADRNQVAYGVSKYLSKHLFAPNQSVTPEEILKSPHFLIGSLDQVCNLLQERRERYGISHIAILDKDMEAFTPVVARLAGK